MIPGAFKGVDLAVFSVYHALGLRVNVLPVIHKRQAISWLDDPINEWGGLSVTKLLEQPDRRPAVKGDWVEYCLDMISPCNEDVSAEQEGEDSELEYDDDEGQSEK